MNVKSTQSIPQTSVTNLEAPETIAETRTQILTKQLFQQLDEALCWQMQTLAEASEEIQKLLEQLKQTNPTATEAEQTAFITAKITPTRREQFVNALQSGWKEAIQEFLDGSYLNIGIATLEVWKNADFDDEMAHP